MAPRRNTLVPPLLGLVALAMMPFGVNAWSTPPAAANGCIAPAAGTPSDPFLINGVVELQCLRDNGGFYWNNGYYFKQTADIDLTAQPTWAHGIGDDTTTFDGTFDGNGFTISNLSVTDSSQVGLFGVTEGATLTGITLIDAVITGTGTAPAPLNAFTFAGGLVGVTRSATAISNVSVSGSVTGVGFSVGGIVGQAGTGSVIANSSTSADVSITGFARSYGGGAVGNTDLLTGGITITDTYATGDVNAGGSTGGLIGAVIAPASITRSYATGDVTPMSLGAPLAGGLIGWVTTDDTDVVVVSQSFATGAVTTPNGSAGGLVGQAGDSNGPTYSGLSIVDSFATGAVTTGCGSCPAGGIVGNAITGTGNGITLTRTYSTSLISAASTATPPPATPPGGGILAGATNSVDVSITGSFWNPTDSSASATSSYGTQSTQAAMRATGVYSSAGWNIAGGTSNSSVWGMCSSAYNGGYPFLQWFAATQGWSCTVPPPPAPPIPASVPLDVVGEGGDSVARVSWEPPASSGSFGVSNYQVSGSPSGSCLTAELSCVVTGLINGMEYSFRVRALTGAGWGAWSEPVTVVPAPPAPEESILISGVREGGQLRVSGATTGLVGSQVTPWVRFPGQTGYSEGVGVRTVQPDGTFTWQRQTRKKIYVYFRAADNIRSNRLVIPAR